MRILQIVLAYLVLSVNTNVFGEITVDNFKKQNCRYGGPPIDGAVVEVKARSKLKCAAECSRQACKSYTYDKTTEACHLSSFLISDESGVWYCAPFSQQPTSSSCSAYFQYYRGVCIATINKPKDSTYEQMNGVCNQINGQLYQIEDMLLISTTKRNILQTYVTDFLKNGHYVIQGRLVICVPPLKCWRNEDGTVAVSLTFFPPPDNVLAINARTGDVDNNGIGVKSTRGFICEEVDIDG